MSDYERDLVKALRCLGKTGKCESSDCTESCAYMQNEWTCTYDQMDKICSLAANAIETLQASTAEKDKRIVELETELEKAMKDLLKVSVCGTCENYAPYNKSKCSKHPRKICDSNSSGCASWKWRGVQCNNR